MSQQTSNTSAAAKVAKAPAAAAKAPAAPAYEVVTLPDGRKARRAPVVTYDILPILEDVQGQGIIGTASREAWKLTKAEQHVILTLSAPVAGETMLDVSYDAKLNRTDVYTVKAGQGQKNICIHSEVNTTDIWEWARNLGITVQLGTDSYGEYGQSI